MAELKLLSRAEIYANTSQPRKTFLAEDLADLAASIQSLKDQGQGIDGTGILQALAVEPLASRYDGKLWRLIAGERRFRASEGIVEFLPCIILNNVRGQSSILALIENVQRKDLLPIEEANAVADLMKSEGLSIREVAVYTGKSAGWVTNRLALLKTGEDVQQVAQTTPGAMSSLLMIDSVQDDMARFDLLKQVQEGAVHSTIKAAVEAHRSAQEAQAREQQFADEETKKRTELHDLGGRTGGSSRGHIIDGGTTAAEADPEVERAILNLVHWLPFASDEVHKKALKLSERIRRGDLSR